jgi:DNA helicase HerA-like ATPase
LPVTLPYAPLTIGYAHDRGAPLTLDGEALTQHGCVLGQTGTGKTAFLASLAVQQIQQGGGLIFCDTKRDARLLRTLVCAAWHADRADQVRVFDVARPVHSYNPGLRVTSRGGDMPGRRGRAVRSGR